MGVPTEKGSEDNKKKEYFNTLTYTEALEPRHSLFGGRMNAVKLFQMIQSREKIKYVDFTR